MSAENKHSCIPAKPDSSEAATESNCLSVELHIAVYLNIIYGPPLFVKLYYMTKAHAQLTVQTEKHLLHAPYFLHKRFVDMHKRKEL